jgi:hypothetical protein
MKKTYLLSAAHAAENKHLSSGTKSKYWEGKNDYKRKIHEATAMHIESNVISQPSH